MQRRAISALASCVLSIAMCSQSLAQSTVPNQDDQYDAVRGMFPLLDEPDCKTATIVTYEAEGAYWIPATIRTCRQGIQDVTAGRYALPRGEHLFLINGLAKSGSAYSLTRGFPNTPYRLLKPEFPLQDYSPGEGDSPTFKDMKTTFPFVPNSLYEYENNGLTKFAYGDLHIIPGREAQAYPLNRNSVIFRVDGYLFSTPDALMAFMETDDRHENPYYEVEYFQLDENPRWVRSAFIPVLSVKEAGAGFVTLAAASPFSQATGSSDHMLAKLAALGVLVTALYLWESVGAGDAWHKLDQDCWRRRGGNSYILC